MAYSRATRQQRGHGTRRCSAGHGPLLGPLLLFCGVLLMAAVYVAYVLWPSWPEAPVSLNAPALPVVVAGTTFNIEPAAIRRKIDRHAGRYRRVDLVYLWPSLKPSGPPAAKPTRAAPLNPNMRLFVTIHVGDGTLPLAARLKEIYPRYLATEIAEDHSGLTVRPFRDDTPYKGEELVYERQTPMQFLARCTRHGVTNNGNCLLERRIGKADITFRFPRDWLKQWRSVASGIDMLLARLHPQAKLM